MGLFDIVEDGWNVVVDTAEEAAEAALAAARAAAAAAADAAKWLGGAFTTATNAGIGFAGAALQVPAVIVDKTGWVLERVSDGVGGFYNELVEPTLEAAGSAASAATGWVAPAFNWGMQQVDTYVFDPTSVLTGGMIDLDWQRWQLSANVGLTGVAQTGWSAGAEGVSVHAETLAGGGGAQVGPDGVAVEVELGSEVLPLPHTEVRAAIGPDGATGGAQVSLTLPGGTEGSVGAEVTVDGDGIDADVEGDAKLVTPLGTVEPGDLEDIDLDDLGNVRIPEALQPAMPEIDLEQTPGELLGIPDPTDLGDVFDAIPTPQDYLDQFPKDPGLDDLAGLYGPVPGSLGELAEHDGLPTIEFPTLDTLPTLDVLANPELPAPVFDPFGDVTAADVADAALPPLFEDVFAPAFQDLVDTPVTAADVGALAGTGELSDVIGLTEIDSPGDAIEAVTTAIAEGQFDDFTGGVVSAEVNEAAADAMWDDLG